jgi:hypothetical protein
VFGDGGHTVPASTAKVLSTLARLGLLLNQDKRLPNVVTLVTGEALSTSWWSHPKGRLIFSVLSELSDHPDVLFTKLLHGKDTLVHRSLWPAFLTVATAAEPWQQRNLSSGARKLLAQVNEAGAPVRSSGPAVKDLVSRLLVHSKQVHTESGRHEMAIESWSVWSAHSGVAPTKSLDEAREAIERACQGIGAPTSILPWWSAESAGS